MSVSVLLADDHPLIGQLNRQVNLLFRLFLIAVVKCVDYPFAHRHSNPVALVLVEPRRFGDAHAHLLGEIHALDVGV